VIRGDAAWNIVRGFNRYNDKPRQDHEYIIAYVDTKVISSENDSPPPRRQRLYFVSNSGVQYEREWVSGMSRNSRTSTPR
jgi:hypothetical protein